MIDLAQDCLKLVLLSLLLAIPSTVAAQSSATKDILRTAHVRSLVGDDPALVENVSQKLAKSPSLAGMDIKVTVKDGVVTLTGTVNSRTKKRLASRIARNVVGIKSVVNHLSVGRIIFEDFECCCNGECWTQSRPCPVCNIIDKCLADYKAAIAAAHGDKTALREARQAFFSC